MSAGVCIIQMRCCPNQTTHPFPALNLSTDPYPDRLPLRGNILKADDEEFRAVSAVAHQLWLCLQGCAFSGNTSPEAPSIYSRMSQTTIGTNPNLDPADVETSDT